MDNIQEPSDPQKPRSYRTGNGSIIPGGNAANDLPYQEPGDDELSPEVQLAWFELNRAHTKRAYLRVMRIGGLMGALVTPLILMAVHYVQANQHMELVIGLPEIHEDPDTAMIYWAVIGVLAGFLIGVGLGALGFWLLQRFNTQ